jgi:hypothetical protein
MQRTFADLLAVPAPIWGARGDPYLWEDLRFHVIQNRLPLPNSIEDLTTRLHSLFEDLTGHSVLESDWFFIEKYAHGGMSSGNVEPSSWKEGGNVYEYIKQCFIRIHMIDDTRRNIE